MSRRKTVAASPSPAPPSPVAPPAPPAPPGGETPSSARASSRKSLRHAARISQVAITTTTETQQQQQDDATFEDLVATNGEEEEDSSSAPRVSEHIETAHASSSLSKKKSTSLSKLQPKGAWKMYDNLSVDHDRHNERGRVQRNTNRPNYEDSRQRVFGHESASNEKKKKREEKKDSDKPGEEAAVSPLKKPRGRPPNGKVWDDDACAYVSVDAAALPIRNSGAKKTAPPVAKKKTTKTELASEVADLKQDVVAMKTEMKDGFAALRDLLASK